MIGLFFTAAFTFSATGETAVTYADRLEVVPLEAGAREFSVEVVERPRKDADGKVTLKADEPFCTFLPARTVNIAPMAHVTVSSKGEMSRGFRPTPGQNIPESLVDERVNRTKNFEFAKRETPPTDADPEWIILDWKHAVPICGLFVMTGANESFPRHDRVHVERYAGKDDPRTDGAADAWKEVGGEWSAEPKNELSNFACWRSWTASAEFSALAIRLRFTGGGWVLRGQKHETPVPGLGEIAVLAPWTKKGRPRRAQEKGFADIPFAMPFDGSVTIQIRDEEGRVIANPVTDIAYSEGSAVARWDLSDMDGNPVLKPGTYTWRGIAVPPLETHYRYAYYPLGIPDDRRPWTTEDNTGGWLADHDPPRGVVRDGDDMWLNAWAEHGDSVIRTDIDMRKKWGQTRFWVAVPQEICVDNGYLYGYSQGGWNGTDEEIIRIDPRQGYGNRKVFLKKNPKPGDGHTSGSSFWDVSVSGFQVLGDTAFVALGRENRICVYDISKGNAAPHRNFSWATVHTQFDEWKPVLVKEIGLPSPGRLRRAGKDRLVTTSGGDVVAIDVRTFAVTKLFSTGIDAKILGCGVGDDGTVWVGAGEPLHQVFGFDAKGRRVQTLGKPGKRRIGKWDNDDLEEPAGVEVDAKGRVWVAEHTHWEKRVSVWDPKTARCVRQVLGPTQYGGDGCIDPEDETRLFYRGLEMRRNPRTGEVKPVNLIYRPDAPEYPRLAPSDYPSYCFRAKGKLWFTSYQHPHGHPQCVLWQLKGDRAMPVAAVGAVQDFKDAFLGKGSITNAVPSLRAEPGMLYAWTDLDDNGRIDADEVRTRVLAFGGQPIPGLGVGWNWRMNARFEVACMTDIYKLGRMVYFKPSGFTQSGYPVYEVPTETKPGVLETQGVMTDAKGNVIALGRPLVSLAPDGTERWRYRNEWPGLHAGHRTTAAGDEPGVLIAPTRMWGIVPTDGEAGEVAAFNSNLGCSYLMTADDGLYISRIFRDQRVAPVVWNYNGVPDPQTMAETSLYDEHFGGTFERVKGADGRHRYCYIVGKGHCGVVELKGLDGIRRLAGGTFEVTPEMVAEASARVAAAAAKKLEPKVANVPRADAKGEWKCAPAIFDGIRLAYDDANLYVCATKNDGNAPFENKGGNPVELFKTGDTVEVMLRTKAEKKARGLCAGDKRLLLSVFGGKPVAVLYDYKVPGVRPNERTGFSSPWRTVYVDRVGILDAAKVAVHRAGTAVTVEAAVPLAALGLDPSRMRETRGDVGRVNSDATGTRAASREYWSNKSTAIMSDLPSETLADPDLWGTFRFGAK